MPAALPGEGAFAASGTCLVVQGDRNAWFGTGGGRVFRSTDRGRSWTVHTTPIRAGNGTSGIFSLAFWDADHGVAVGGDYKEPDRAGQGLRSFFRRRPHLEASTRPRTGRLSFGRHPRAGFNRTDPDRCRPDRNRPVGRRRRDLDETQRRRLPRRGDDDADDGMGRRRARADRPMERSLKNRSPPLEGDRMRVYSITRLRSNRHMLKSRRQPSVETAENQRWPKILIGGVVGGIVIFFWGFVSHMLLPLGEMGMQSIPQEEALAAAMKDDVREPGLYFVPGRDDEQTAIARRACRLTWRRSPRDRTASW